MYRYLRYLEAAFPVQSDYLGGCHVSSKMRSVLVDWLVDVQQQFKLLQETLFLSVDILDRFFSPRSNLNSNLFVLLSRLY
jgi:hypothetical protein